MSAASFAWNSAQALAQQVERRRQVEVVELLEVLAERRVDLGLGRLRV